MKEIECPQCGEMIPDDSKYCDMCGAELLECISCGTLGTDAFCPECGKPMVSRKRSQATEATPTGPTPMSPAPDDTTGHGTVCGRRKSLVLRARRGNVMLIPQEDAIIGRTEGPYARVLGGMDLISRKHGRFVKRGREWYIEDLNSTNGIYINDREVKPGTVAKFGPGDVVDLGTYLFDVVEE